MIFVGTKSCGFGAHSFFVQQSIGVLRVCSPTLTRALQYDSNTVCAILIKQLAYSLKLPGRFVTQCAAVMTYLSPMRAPPHLNCTSGLPEMT